MRSIIALALPIILGCGAPPANNDNTGDNTNQDANSNDTTNTGDTGDTNNIIDPRDAAAKITLPPGVSLDPASLLLSTIVGDAPVAADGTVTAQIITAAPSLVQVVEPGGKPILFGFIGRDSGPADLSARSTAAALLFLSVGGPGTSPDRIPDLLDIINNSSATQTLADAIAAAMAANPTAIADGSDALTAAITTANKTIINDALNTPAKSGGSPRIKSAPAAGLSSLILQMSNKSQTRMSSSPDFPVLIDPGADIIQSGVQILQNSDGGGIIAQNNFRRRATMFAYLVATQSDTDPKPVPAHPPTLTGMPLEIPGTVRLTAFTAAGSFTGHVPFAPVQTAPFSLPREGSAVKTFYKLVVVGPSLGGITGVAYSDPDINHFRSDWDAKIADLNYEMAVWDFLVPVIEFISIGGGSSVDVATRAASVASFRALLDPEISALGIAVDLTRSAGYRTWVSGLIADMFNPDRTISANGTRLLTSLLATDATLATKTITLQRMKAGLARAAASKTILVAVDLAMGALDLLAVSNDLASSTRDELWNATVTERRVHLDPMDSTIPSAAQPGVVLTATVNGLPNGIFLYRWSTTGQHGKIFEALGQQGTSFDSTESSVQYIADIASLQPGKLDTVKVEVFDKNGDTIAPDAVSLGDQTATINGPLCNHPSDIVNIPYAPLANLVSSLLGKPVNQITCADMATLTTIDTTAIVNFGSGVPNPLEGLQYAINLQSLNLNFCLINNAADFDRIKDLTKLTALDVGRTNIGLNMNALRRLTNLVSLNLNDAQVSDVTALSGMTQLQSLGLEDESKLTSLDGLEHLTALITLDCFASKIEDINAIAASTHIKTLDLNHNNVEDISALSSMSELESLVIACGTSVIDIAPLANKPALTNLNLQLRSARVRDLSPLASSTALQMVSIPNTQAISLDPLNKAKGMFQLEINGLFPNCDALSGCPFTDVFLYSPNLTNINGLTTLNGAVNVGLNGTPINSVLPIVQSHMSSGVVNISCTPAEVNDTTNVKALRDRGIVVPMTDRSTCP